MDSGMRNAQLAESILSLVTSPERAASTVGDLMETAADRGALAFWIGLLRTTFGFLWSDFAEDPRRTIVLAVQAFVLECVILIVFVTQVVLIGFAIGMSAYFFGTPLFPHWALAGIAEVLKAFAWIAIPLKASRWLARNSPGRKLAPCLALTMISLAVRAAAHLEEPMLGITYGVMLTILSPMTMFAGAVWDRRKRMSR